jgi:quinol monooxygenase YgiN
VVSVLVIIDLKAKPGSADELRVFLNPAQIRAYAGNEGVELAVSQDDPSNVLLVEHWASREAYEVYRAWRVEAGDQATLVGLLEGGFEGMNVRVFDIVETARIKRSKSRDEALEDLEEWSKRWLTLRAQIRELADQKLSAEHLGPVIKLHNEELDSIMSELSDASE